MAKLVEEKRATTVVRGFVIFAFIVSALIIILGSGLNDLNLKYSRVSKIPRTCKRELFILTVPNSQLCCDSPFNADDWVCVASFDTLNRILSSKWAFQIPVIPLVLTIITELASALLGADLKFVTRLESHGCRLFLYICMILLRTYVLYIGGGYIQSALQKSTKQDNSCWYSGLTRGSSCNNQFDYSDHIVLYLAQYVLPSVIELAYVRIQCTRKDRDRSSAARYILTIAASLSIVLVSLRGMLLTGMFFHTGAESLVAVLVVFFLVVGPVLMYSGSSYFMKALLPGLVDLRDD